MRLQLIPSQHRISGPESVGPSGDKEIHDQEATAQPVVRGRGPRKRRKNIMRWLESARSAEDIT
jgi:hypothetical protein